MIFNIIDIPIKTGVILTTMSAKDTKSQRLSLISKWKRSSLSRERPKTPDALPEPKKKSVRRNSTSRECLIPISNESTVVTEKQSLPPANK